MLWALKKYWKTALWLFWQYLYYCSGLFIWHYIFKRVAHICCSVCLCKEQYATGPSCPNADQKQHRMHMASSTPPPHHAQAYGIIQTWKYCKIYDSCNVPRSFLGSRRFVAHVDTGNRANTAISKAAFQALFPGGRGAVCKGSQWVQGATGTCEYQPVVEISYELDGVVGPNKKQLRVSVDANITWHLNDDLDILISTKDMKIFHDRFGYVIQPVEKSALLRM